MMPGGGCTVCRPWFSRSWEQLSNRKVNMKAAPDVDVYPCPSCGTTDWVSSTAEVRPTTSKAETVTIVAALWIICLTLMCGLALLMWAVFRMV